MVPRPILPLFTGFITPLNLENVCVYKDAVVTTEPAALVPVTHTVVGSAAATTLIGARDERISNKAGQDNEILIFRINRQT